MNSHLNLKFKKFSNFFKSKIFLSIWTEKNWHSQILTKKTDLAWRARTLIDTVLLESFKVSLYLILNGKTITVLTEI